VRPGPFQTNGGSGVSFGVIDAEASGVFNGDCGIFNGDCGLEALEALAEVAAAVPNSREFRLPVREIHLPLFLSTKTLRGRLQRGWPVVDGHVVVHAPDWS